MEPGADAVNFIGYLYPPFTALSARNGLFTVFQCLAAQGLGWGLLVIMSSAQKISIRKPVASDKRVPARSSLRRAAVAAAAPTPDADGEEALGRAMSSLVKGGLFALVLMFASAGTYIYIMQNQHKSFQELVQGLLSSPEPTFLSRVEACSVPPVLLRGSEATFSADLPKSVNNTARATEAATQFIDCIVTTDPRRYCAQAARSTLAADLKVYAQVRATLKADIEAAQQVMPNDRMDRSLVEPIKVETAKALDAAAHQFELADAINGKVAALTRAGLLSPSDFGVFGMGVPPYLANALNAAATPSAECPG